LFVLSLCVRSEPALEDKVSRPPAALTAATLSHVVMVISPIVPVSVLGFLVSLMQQKTAFQPRGVRRLCLSVKKANILGECMCTVHWVHAYCMLGT
jgi:type III secretory pathway component EscS